MSSLQLVEPVSHVSVSLPFCCFFVVDSNPTGIDFSQPEYVLRESLMNYTVPVMINGGRLPIATVIEVNPGETSSTAGELI